MELPEDVAVELDEEDRSWFFRKQGRLTLRQREVTI